MRTKEWADLVKRYAIPRLEGDVRVHNGWIVLGEIDWLARAIGFRVASYDKRMVSNFATVIPLFDPLAVTGGIARDLGQTIPNHYPWVTVPEDDEDGVAAAMATLVDRMVTEGMPHLQTIGTLDAVRAELAGQARAERSRAAVVLEPLAYACFLLGDVDGAVAAAADFADLVTALGAGSPAAKRLGVARGRLDPLLVDPVDHERVLADLRVIAVQSAKDMRLPPPTVD